MVPGEGFCKRIIIQGRQLPPGLPVIGQSHLRRKGDIMGASVHAPIQRNSTYVRTDVQNVCLWDQMTRTPSLPNPPIWKIPPGNLFSAPLQGAQHQDLSTPTSNNYSNQRAPRKTGMDNQNWQGGWRPPQCPPTLDSSADHPPKDNIFWTPNYFYRVTGIATGGSKLKQSISSHHTPDK